MYISKPTCDVLRKMKIKGIVNGLGITSDEHKDALATGKWVYFDTYAGWARISIISDCEVMRGRWSPGFVACQFDDPGSAIAHDVACNPYSGKWNFHHNDVKGTLSMETALRLLQPKNVRLQP